MSKRKIGLMALLLVSAIGLGIVMSGCDAIGPSATTTTLKPATTTTTTSATTTSTGAGTTTTTTTSTTTTTHAPPYSISGTISSGEAGNWGWGALKATVFNDAEFMDPTTFEAEVLVPTGETSVTFEITGLGNGTYYLAAALWLGTMDASGDPPTDSPLGEFSDGYFLPLGTGSPEQVVILGFDRIDIDWPLNAKMPMP